MSKDEAIGKLVRLVEQCDEPSIARLCQEVEESLEYGPYGVCTLSEPHLAPIARSADKPAAWEVVAACTSG